MHACPARGPTSPGLLQPWHGEQGCCSHAEVAKRATARPQASCRSHGLAGQALGAGPLEAQLEKPTGKSCALPKPVLLYKPLACCTILATAKEG